MHNGSTSKQDKSMNVRPVVCVGKKSRLHEDKVKKMNINIFVHAC